MDRVDDLGRAGLKIVQRAGVAFSMDAVLLAHFARVKPGECLCDLGTGTGVVPLLIAVRGAATVVGLELLPDLAAVAARNVRDNGLSDRVRIVRGDLRTATLEGLGMDRPFDVVTANPPFRSPGSGRVSPDGARAIARHEISCTIGDVLRAAGRLARHGGRLYLVYLSERLTDLLTAMRSVGLEPKRVRPVRPFPGGPAKLILAEGRRGGRPGLVIQPDLVIRDTSGEYTPEARAIYGLGP